MKRLRRRLAIITLLALVVQSTFGVFTGNGFLPAKVASAFDVNLGDATLFIEGKRFTPDKKHPYTYLEGAHVYILHLQEGDILAKGAIIHNYEGSSLWCKNDKEIINAQDCNIYYDGYRDGKKPQTITKRRPYTPYTTESAVKVTKLEKVRMSGKYTNVNLYLETVVVQEKKAMDMEVNISDINIGDILGEKAVLKTDGLDDFLVTYNGNDLRKIVGPRGELFVPYSDAVVVDRQVDNTGKLTIALEKDWGEGEAGTEATLNMCLKKDEKVTLADNVYIHNTIVIDDGKTHEIEMNGYSIIKEYTRQREGGIFLVKNGSKLIISSQGEAGGYILGGNAVRGGGICLEDSASLIMNGGRIMDGFAVEGAGLYIGTGCRAELYDAEIDGNNYSSVIFDSGEKYIGGGIRVAEGADCKIKDSVICDNRSINGGGIANSGTLEIENSKITGGYSAGGTGGGIWSDGEVYVKNTEFSENWGASNGGAIANLHNMTIEDCIIQRNNVGKNGGGFYIDYKSDEGKTVFSGENEISSNRAEEYGGGIYIVPGDDKQTSNVMQKITFNYNCAVKGGGALFIGEGSKENSINDVIMQNNYCNGNGGAVYVKSPLSATNSIIRQNNAGKKGGGIYADYDGNKYNLTISDSSIQENNCADNGGGIWIQDNKKSARLVLPGGKTVIGMNTVTDGGAKNAELKENNLVFSVSREIKITGEFKKGSVIGVTCADEFSSERRITKGYSDYNSEPTDTYFSYNGPDHKVKVDDELPEVVLTNKLTATASGYKIKLSIKVTNDADDWDDSHIDIYCKKNNGTGEEVLHYTSEDITGSIDHSEGEYDMKEIDCGTAFPSKVNVYTNFGGGEIYRGFEADVKILINNVNCASQHIVKKGWGNMKKKGVADNWIKIDGKNSPYPDEFEVNQKREIDLLDEKSRQVTVYGVDQYGVAWETKGNDNFKMENISFPGEDLFECKDNSGLKWRFDTTKTEECHNSIYKLSFKTANTYNKWKSVNIGVRFRVPLYVSIQVGNDEDGYKDVERIGGHQNDSVTIDLPKIPNGYKLGSVKKNGACVLMEKPDNNGKYDFVFMTQNVKLVFITEPIRYYIKYNKNIKNVTGSISNMTVYYNQVAVLAKNAFKSKKGYTFAGWNTEPDGTGTAYKEGDEVKNLTDSHRETITLYAQWKDAQGNQVTASLFSEGNLVMWVGSALFAAAIIVMVGITLVRKKKGVTNA
jgi:uncharacterized repeat protein (TIGR02543 family)